MTTKYQAGIKKVVLHGRFFSDHFLGDHIDNLKEDEGLSRIVINFKDGSTVIHKGSYTIDLFYIHETKA